MILLEVASGNHGVSWVRRRPQTVGDQPSRAPSATINL
jgi:hypothetical protein